MVSNNPYLGKIPILTNIFQLGWNHHLVNLFLFLPGFYPGEYAYWSWWTSTCFPWTSSAECGLGLLVSAFAVVSDFSCLVLAKLSFKGVNSYYPQKFNIGTKKGAYLKGNHLFQTMIWVIHLSFQGCRICCDSRHLLFSIEVGMESSSKRRTLMPLTTSMWAYTRCGYVAGSSVRWGGSRMQWCTKNRSPHKACFNQQSLFATLISIKWEIPLRVSPTDFRPQGPKTIPFCYIL